MKETISTEDAPAAVGAYSQGTRSQGSLVFTAGQIPLTPDGELLSDASMAAQTRRVLDNVAAVLAAGGAGMEDVVKVTVYLADIDDFEAMNEVYATYFDDEPPARTAIQAGALPLGARLEIEAVASVE